MAKEVNVKLNVESTQAEKALNKFGGTLEDLYGEGVQPLNFAIGELEDRLYEMAAAGQTGTKEFREMATEVGRMKKTIIDVDLAVDGLAMTTSQQLSGSMMGVAAGFELAQGAMGAFGVESEKVEEMLLKVQSASAITDGLQGIKESVASFKALKNSIMATTVVQKAAAVAGKIFNAVLTANPIGLIITAIAALVAGIVALIKNFRAVTDWLGITDSASEEFNKNELARLEKLNKAKEKALKKFEEDTEWEIQKRKAAGKETFEMELSYHKKRMQLQKEMLKSIAEEIKARLAAGDVTEEEYKKFTERIKQSTESHKESKRAIEMLEIEHEKKVSEKRKQAYEKNKALNEKELAEERARQIELQKIKMEELALIEELDELIYQAGLSAKDKELVALNDFYFEKIELAKQYGLDVTALEEEQAKKVKEINEKYEQEKRDRDAAIFQEVISKQNEARQEQLERDQAVEDAKLDMATQALTNIASLTELFAGKNEKAARAAFNIQKGVNIALATADTYKAATAAFASAAANPITIANPAFPSIMAGIAVAGGLANVAKIAATKFEGGGAAGGGSGFSAPSVTARPAEFNIVGNSGTNQLAETLSSQPMKAYVVGSEVTTQQALDRNRVKNASI